MLAVRQRHSKQVCDGAIKLATTSSILAVATLSLIVTLLFDVRYNLCNFGIRPLHGNNAPSSATRLNLTLSISCFHRAFLKSITFYWPTNALNCIKLKG